jgi:hypothetical protein
VSTLEDRFPLRKCDMKIGRSLADRDKEQVSGLGASATSMIASFATASGTTEVLRFVGAIVGVIALFWLIGVLFDRWDKKAD